MATGVSSTLTGGGALNISQGASPYPDITADTEQQNTTDFEGMLATSAFLRRRRDRHRST